MVHRWMITKKLSNTWFGGILSWMLSKQDLPLALKHTAMVCVSMMTQPNGGTKRNSWLEMALEELDDLAIYVQADELRKVKFATEQGSKRYTHEAVEYREILESLAQVRLKIMELLELVDDA